MNVRTAVRMPPRHQTEKRDRVRSRFFFWVYVGLENKKAVANATAFYVFGAQERTRTSTMLLAST